MTTQELERINVLAAKARVEQTLTDEERAEQMSLRQQYMNEIKISLRTQLEDIKVQNEDGSITPLKKKDTNNKKNKTKQD